MNADKKVHDYFNEVFERMRELARLYDDGLYTGPETVCAMQVSLHDTQELCSLVGRHNKVLVEIRDFFYDKEYPQKE